MRPLSIFALVVALGALALGIAAPALAQDNDNAPTTRKRASITVHPRGGQLSPNAKRYCRSWLEQEYRVSGPVIVPRMQCWWQ